MAIGAQSLPLTLLSTRALSGGNVLTEWAAPGLTINVASEPGATVSLIPVAADPGQESLMLVVAPPAHSSPAATPSLGVDQAAVQQASDSHGAQAPAPPAMTSAATSARAEAKVASSNSPFHVACTNVQDNSSGESWSSCLDQTWLATGSGSCGCWYSSNQISSSVYQAPNYGWGLSKIEEYYCYCNGYTYNRVGDWGPEQTYFGPSGSFTLSAGFGGLSASITQALTSNTRLDPNYPNGTTDAAFGSTWSSSSGTVGQWDSAKSVAIVNPGVGSPGDADLHQIVTITS